LTTPRESSETPVYEYRCTTCGHVFEAEVDAGSGKDLACSNCGHQNLLRGLALPASLNAKAGGMGRTDRSQTERPTD
jgi:putative FmdB family regulatory protein